MAKPINPTVARHVAIIVKVERTGNLSSGSAFIDAFRAMTPMIAMSPAAERKPLATKLGTDFAMAYEKASKADAGDKARTLEEMKSIRSRCTRALMIGQRAWWPSAFDNLERMHKLRHVGYSQVRDLLGEVGKLSEAPSLNSMEKTRAKLAIKKRTGDGTNKRKRLINAMVPLDAMAASLAKTGRWRAGAAKDAPVLPRVALSHLATIQRELKTVREMVAKAIEEAKAEAE